MNSAWKVFLDMDGVIADFVSACVAAHKRSNPYEGAESHGIFDMEKLWKITMEEFWLPINAGGFDFWANLDAMPDADGIVQAVIDFAGGPDNVCVLTSPSMDPYCIPGKRAWMDRKYPQLSKNMLFGSAKHFLAGPRRVLIDDRDKNLDDFEVHGGTVVCTPRIWNREHRRKDSAAAFVKSQLARLA